MAAVPETELPYEDDDYIYINHRNPEYEDIYNMWRRAMHRSHPPMISNKLELETIFFTGSDFRGNVQGFNINPGMIYLEQAGEIRRRSTSNLPSNLSEESLVVLAKRAGELM